MAARPSVKTSTEGHVVNFPRSRSFGTPTEGHVSCRGTPTGNPDRGSCVMPLFEGEGDDSDLTSRGERPRRAGRRSSRVSTRSGWW